MNKLKYGLIFRLLITLTILPLFYNPLFGQIDACETSDVEIYDQKTVSQTEPFVMVVFGATGDLTARKLLPALYNLAIEGNLADQFAMVGFARGEHSDETFRNQMAEAFDQFSKNNPRDIEFWDQFEKKIYYNQADFEQDQGYENLQKLLLTIDQNIGTKGNRIYYLATQPKYFPIVIKKLYEHGLINNADSEHWTRVVIEKPFGTDLDSAINLQNEISKYLDDTQVYRIDHYLGKEGVQKLATLRFISSEFEPFWNNQYIDNVQITLSEDIGIGTRADFWEETGWLRDVFQNHLMQLLAHVGMEPPSQLISKEIYSEKVKVLNAIRPLSLEEMNKHMIRGQYGPGEIHGINVPGYKQEKGVSVVSLAETYVAAKLWIDNSRWSGVPFYLRGGKRLPKQTTEIVISFKNEIILDNQSYNALYIRIQPNPGIFLRNLSEGSVSDIEIKLDVIPQNGKTFSEAYERLIFDCAKGDSRLYVGADEHFAAWRLITPVLNYWKTLPYQNIENYSAGTWGPLEADEMLRECGHQWHQD